MAMVDGLSCERGSVCERERERERERKSKHCHISALQYQSSRRTETYIGGVTKWLPIFCFWLEITENCVFVVV
jgi:hypothetical protein